MTDNATYSNKQINLVIVGGNLKFNDRRERLQTSSSRRELKFGSAPVVYKFGSAASK